MTFWNYQEIRRRVPSEDIIAPYRDEQVQGCAYELRLGHEVCVTSDRTRKAELGENESIGVPSGQFALLLTEEVLNIPNDTLAFISVKFGIKAKGLVNVSGFHVDPGFRGRLKFSVYNAGAQDIILTTGDLVFMIWFCDLKGPTDDLYGGIHQDQMQINSADVQLLQGELASPGQLRAKLEQVELGHTYNKYILTTLVAVLVAIALALWKEPPAHVVFDIKEAVKAELREEWLANHTLESASVRRNPEDEPETRLTEQSSSVTQSNHGPTVPQ